MHGKKKRKSGPRTIYTAGIIGTGRIGFSLGFDKKREQPASHTAALQAEKRVRIVAGCDSDAKKLRQWGKYNPQARLFSSAEDFFFQEPIPDILVLAVNESEHLRLASEALFSGARLMILEKPVARNEEEGRVLRGLALKSRTPVLVNHERRFARDYRLAQTLIRAGVLGDIQTVRGVLCSNLRVYTPDAEQTGAYSLLHDGTHLIDAIHFLMDAPETGSGGKTGNTPFRLQNPEMVRCTLAKPEDGGAYAVSNLTAFFQTQGGTQITLEISGRSRFFDFQLELTGTKGRLRIGNGVGAVYTGKESRLYSGFISLEKDPYIRFPKKTRYFRNVVKNAADFLDGKHNLLSTLDDGLAALEVIGEIKAEILRQYY